MFNLTKTAALAILAGSLLAATMTAPTYARDGGGPAFRPTCASCGHVAKPARKKLKKAVRAKKVRKGRKARRSTPWASSYDPATGRRITAIGNGDGTRTVIGIGAGFGPFGIQIWTSN